MTKHSATKSSKGTFSFHPLTSRPASVVALLNQGEGQQDSNLQSAVEIRRKFFTSTADPQIFRCTCGKNIKKNKNGYSNLVCHVRYKHWKNGTSNLRDNDGHLTGTEAARHAGELYEWINLVVKVNIPLSIVSNESYRPMFIMAPKSQETVLKCVERLGEKVNETIKLELKNKIFGLVIDHWSYGNSRFAAVFAVFDALNGLNPSRTLPVYRLIAFTSMEEYEDFAAAADEDYLSLVLEPFGVQLQEAAFLVGDNLSTKEKMTWDHNRHVPLIGCASHRFNQACRTLFADSSDLLCKAQKVVTDLQTFPSLFALRKLARERNLEFDLGDETRWNPALALLKTFFEVSCLICTENGFDEDLVQSLPSADEMAGLHRLFQELNQLEHVTNVLQKEDSSLLVTRRVFDQVMSFYGNTAKFCAVDAENVLCPDFENGIAKIIAGDELHLTAEEEAQCQCFLLPEFQPSAAQQATDGAQVDVSHFTSCINRAYASARQQRPAFEARTRRYRNLSWIPSTSNVLERIFGINCYDIRSGTDLPSRTEEYLLSLRVNRDAWDEKMLQEIIEVDANT